MTWQIELDEIRRREAYADELDAENWTLRIGR